MLNKKAYGRKKGDVRNHGKDEMKMKPSDTSIGGHSNNT
jgi:hypothetical protein